MSLCVQHAVSLLQIKSKAEALKKHKMGALTAVAETPDEEYMAASAVFLASCPTQLIRCKSQYTQIPRVYQSHRRPSRNAWKVFGKPLTTSSRLLLVRSTPPFFCFFVLISYYIFDSDGWSDYNHKMHHAILNAIATTPFVLPCHIRILRVVGDLWRTFRGLLS